MRYFDVALYIIIFNLVLGFLQPALAAYSDASIGQVGYLGESDITEAESKITSRINDVYTPVFSELNWLVENVRLAVQGVATFAVWLGKCTILFPILWYELGGAYLSGSVWASFVTLISLPFYFIYTMAIIQLASGRSMKEAQ